jgi:hypothetical protein
MKVVIVRSLADISEVPTDKSAPIITRDGAKMISLSIVGTTALNAAMGVLTSLLSALDADMRDKSIYIMPCSLSANSVENRCNVIVGVTGMLDLEDRFKALNKDLLTPLVPVVEV